MAGPAGGAQWPAESLALGELRAYRAYARRWVFLLVVSLLSYSNAMVQAGAGRGARGGGGGCPAAGLGPQRRPRNLEPLSGACGAWGRPGCALALGSISRRPEGTVGRQGQRIPATTQGLGRRDRIPF